MTSSLNMMLIFVLIFTTERADTCKSKPRKITTYPEEKQKDFLSKARIMCMKKILHEPYPTAGLYCNATFDDLMCWPYTPVGQTARQLCPHYINGFYQDGYVTKQCMWTGKWYFHHEHNTTWTNYKECIPDTADDVSIVSPLMQEHLGNIRLLYYVGYGISLVSLCIAVSLMLFLKKLHCQRNIIHVNFFISFILRCIICIVKDVELNVATVHVKNGNWTTELVYQGDWKCKLLFSTFHYILGANYMWMFVEGLYLHTLIFVVIFQQKMMLKFYVLFGWCSPLLFVVPWVIVRLKLEDVLCWNTHDHDKGYYWIMRGPIITSIIINFLFFLNIIRVLFTKLMASNTRDPNRYRKLGRSTMVLIPLFGVHYVVFLIIPDCLDDNGEVIKFYLEMFCNSIQGFIVSILFCYINGEVRSELRKKWTHLCLWMNRSSSVRSTTVSSISFYQSRDKGSQSAMLTDLYCRDTALSGQVSPTGNDQLIEIKEDENKTDAENGLLSQVNGSPKNEESNGGRYIKFDAIAEESEENVSMITY